jgi:hypothetical protein
MNAKSKARAFLVMILAIAIMPLTTRAAVAVPPKITAEQARAAAEEIAHLIEAHYVFPEKRENIAAAIRKAAADRRYDVEDPYIFADRITTDLRAAGNDAHLGVRFHPERTSWPAHHGPSAHPQPNEKSPGRSRNEGFEELKILPGNIRYVKITNFMWTNDVTAKVTDEVARFLGEGDAVIIDLRGNGGGNASAVARLISYFMKDDNQVLMTFYDGMSGDVTVSRVKDDLRAPRMVGKPLYTLIADGTASAAEEFAYHVQQFKLGSLVGEKTAGAANNNEHFPVEPGFIVSVSIGRPVHPVSKTNWEGSGIAPTDRVPAASALEQAQLLALHRLAENAPETDRKAYTWAIEDIEARLHPFSTVPRNLEVYSGKYGIRTIRVENGTLLFQRQGQSPKKLMPMAPDLFAFAETDQIRVKFRRSGNRVIGFDQITDDGQILPSERD